MSRLILLRHGQASFGNELYDQLSLLGQSQALETGKHLQDRLKDMTHVLQGPRARHAQTLALVLQHCKFNGPIETDDRLDEFAEGNEIYAATAQISQASAANMQNASSHDQVNAYMETCRKWADSEAVISDRLSVEVFFNQANDWLHDLMRRAQNSGGLTILAVTSAGVIAAVMCIVLNLPRSSWHAFLTVISNCSVTEFLFTAKRCSLLSFNWQMLQSGLTSNL